MKLYSISTLMLAVAIAFTTTDIVAQQSIPTDRYYSVPQDNQPFFFQPSQISPSHTGIFGNVMNRFSDHPLSAINRNPAGLNNIDTQNYLYLDVKTVPDEDLRNIYSSCIICMSPSSIASPTGATIAAPTYESRITQEPFLSAAYFTKLRPESALRIGLTYQLLSIDESFYQLRSLPHHNPYGPRPYGSRLYSTGSLLATTTDFPAGREQQRTLGHYPSFYAGYEFSPRLSAGLKISYNYYSGNGTQVTEDFGTQTDPTLSQTNTISRERDVTYNHWDFSAGIQALLSESITMGVSAGFLTGNFDQDGRSTYLQNYLNPHDSTEDYYYSMFSLFSREGFARTGDTYYADTHIEFKISDNSDIQINYRISRSDQEFNFGESSFIIRDIENSSPNDDGETVLWVNEEKYNTLTRGDGDSELWQHNFSAGFRHDLGRGFHLQTGLLINFDVDKESFDDLQQQLSGYYSYQESGGERTEEQRTESNLRTLNSMEVRTYRTTGFVPLIIGKNFGEQFYVELGVIGHYRSEINKYDRQLGLDNYSLHIGEEEESSEYQSRSFYDLRYNQNETLFNGFSSITFSPDSRISLRLMGFSDRRQINQVSSLDALRLQFSAEISF